MLKPDSKYKPTNPRSKIKKKKKKQHGKCLKTNDKEKNIQMGLYGHNLKKKV